MEAASRAEVVSALRAKGIRPIKVVAADGSKANGEVRGVRKRVVVAAVFGAAVVTAILTVIIRSTPTPSTYTSGDAASPRHQIYGDPVVVEAFERGDFDKVLTNRVDQMLAWFAQPGKLMCPKGTDPRRMGEEFAAAVETERGGGATGKMPVAPVSDGQGGRQPGDAREVRELQQIVRGMREEMAAYLANGNGTPRSFWRRLLERTQQEMQIYERARRELEKEKNPTVWEERNEALRRLGLRTITNHREEE